MAANSAYAYKDITVSGHAELSHVAVNPGKVLPATATGNLFSVSGTVLVTSLVGVVSTVFAATNVSPTIGVTGANAAIAAAPAAPYNATAAGAVIVMPTSGGGALPAAVVAQAAAASAALFTVTAANITITTNATNTGAITWICQYVPVSPGAAVTAV